MTKFVMLGNYTQVSMGEIRAPRTERAEALSAHTVEASPPPSARDRTRFGFPRRPHPRQPGNEARVAVSLLRRHGKEEIHSGKA